MNNKSAGQPVVAVQDLTAKIDSTTILENINFQVFKGELFAILGESGCGKSTLLRNIIGLQRPAKGKIEINGVDMTNADPDTLHGIRQKIGVLFQSNALFTSMTLSQNIAFPLKERKIPGLNDEIIYSIVKMKLGMVNLSGYGNHYPSELSGGQQKRAGLARAIVLDPEILFLDEPWSGLDPVTAAEMDNLIKSINEGMRTTVVIVTQELESILTITKRVIMLGKEKKGIIAEGDPRELKEKSKDPKVADFFNRRTPGGKQDKTDGR